jgi:hypothetical protein
MDGKLEISAMDQLSQLIGLEEVIDRFKSYREFRRRSEEGSFNYSAAHMVFMGNPGTGKKTVARLFGEILHEDGFLSKGHFVSVSASDILGEQVGETTVKAQKVCDSARGGVLYVYDASGLEGDYASEALVVLIQFMADNPDSLIILSGSPEQMKRVMDINPGLRRRMGNLFLFRDYTDDELTGIFRNLMEAEGIRVSEDALPCAKAFFSALPRDASFRNAWEASKLMDLVKANQGRRLLEKGQLSEDDLLSVLPQDFPIQMDSCEKSGNNDFLPESSISAFHDNDADVEGCHTEATDPVGEPPVREDGNMSESAGDVGRLEALYKTVDDLRGVIDNIQFNVSVLVQNQASAADVAVMRRENEAFRSDSNMKLMRRYGIDGLIRVYQAICDRIFQLNKGDVNAFSDGEIKALKWVLKRLKTQLKSLGIRLQSSPVGSPVNESCMVVYGSDGEDVDESDAICRTNDMERKDTVKESVCPAFIWTIPSLVGDEKEWCMAPEKVCIYK